MRNFLLILLLAISLQSFGQKNYRIKKCIWSITPPAAYSARVDNFEKIVKAGETYIKKQKNDSVTLSTDDTVLFSLAKTDSVQMNIVLASYKNNESIEQYTLKGYAEILGEYLETHPKDNSPKNTVNVLVRELVIDKMKFYLIRKTTNYTVEKYSYTSDYYVAEIEGKEFSITAIYDNEFDKQKIEKAVLESTFK
ncbi:MAG: hypothetical protein ACSHW4_01980 [Cellulophaga sp.]